MKIVYCVFAAAFMIGVSSCGSKSGNNNYVPPVSTSSTEDDQKTNDETDEMDKNPVSDNDIVSETAETTEKTVNSSDGLLMRDKPGVEGTVLTVIPNKNKVVVLEEKVREDNILKKQGYWVKVKWKNFTGYCFDGFLK